MTQAALTLASGPRRRARQTTQAKLDHILAGAALVFAKRGFEGATIRDVGDRVGVSLAGMYYYFTNKEHLLFQIQRRTFDALLQSQMPAAESNRAAPLRLGDLIRGHLRFFAAHPNEMKVCTFELESLTGDLYRRVLELRRRYYRLMAGVVAQAIDGATRRPRESARSRKATLALFGMLNWVFMWYDKGRDGSIDQLSDEMTHLFLNGITGERGR
ncbi:MAG: TetR/AcrR family transcriptional regulator [Gemmatimonadetes bacterium]|nr:TetR/AcrR family transcriptional regulator [Gemmatimonadota bacterium]